MVIAIAILISIVVSLGVSIYFHGLSKNNNSMEKVKK